MATTKLTPEIRLPDDVFRSLVNALADLVLADLEVEAKHDVGNNLEQDVELNRPHSGRH